MCKGKELPAGFELALFGNYTRRASTGERVQVVKLQRQDGDQRHLYLRIDDDCPGLFANDPAYATNTSHIQSDDVIVEFKDRDYGHPGRLCIVFHSEVDAKEADRELWVTYHLAQVDGGGIIGQSTKQATKPRKHDPDSAESVLMGAGPGDGGTDESDDKTEDEEDNEDDE